MIPKTSKPRRCTDAEEKELLRQHPEWKGRIVGASDRAGLFVISRPDDFDIFYYYTEFESKRFEYETRQAEAVEEKHAERVYLSGPMTGIPEHNFPAFHAAAKQLRSLGYEVSNPAEINTETGGDWHYYLRNDIKALCDCDTLILLPGWEGSRGAHLEIYVAHRLGIKVIQLEKLIP